jgi:ribosome-associated protein
LKTQGATATKTLKKATKGPVKRVTNTKLGTSSSQRSRSVASRTRTKDSGSGSRKSRGQQPPEDRARVVALAIAEVGLENKALNVEIIDVRGKVDYSDYVVVMSGRSDRQVNALGRHIEEELQQKHKARCLGVEGMPSGTWLLMDYGDVVVHIFHEDTRGYYDLETLWIDAARVTTSASASSPSDA